MIFFCSLVKFFLYFPKVYKPTPSISTEFSPSIFSLDTFSSFVSLLDKISEASLVNDVINNDSKKNDN